MLCNFQPINSTGSMSVNACYEPVDEQVSLLPDKAPASRTLTFNPKAVVLALAIVGVVMIATIRVKQSAPQKSGALRSSSLAVVLEEEEETHTLREEHAVSVLLAGLKDLEGSKTEKRNWVEDRMQRVKSVATVRALHQYYHIIGRSELIGGPYVDQAEGQEARKLIELGLHKYDGDDWKEYMNEEKATRKPPKGKQAGVGTTASLVAQVLPPDEKFVILILAWLPIDKYPWAGKGGVGAAHTHGQATCNFKFLNVVDNAGNTFYDVAGGSSTQTDMFNDGLPHKGGCKDHEYKPVLVTPRVGRDFIPSKDLVGATSGYIQDDHGAHSIDNMNSTHIAFSIHVYYPPYRMAWAFHENTNRTGQKCSPRHRENHGHANCENPYQNFCTVTSMSKYLDEAADWKKHHGDEDPIKWFHTFCEHITNAWLHKQCTKHYGKYAKHVEDIVWDPTLQQ